jgi:hypothetical protein
MFTSPAGNGPAQTGDTHTMTTRGGFTLNGIHFNQTDSQRAGSPQTFFFLDGKRTSRADYGAALAQAKAAEAEAADRAAAAAAIAADQADAVAAKAARADRLDDALDGLVAATRRPRRLSLRDAAMAVVNAANLRLEPEEFNARVAALAAALNPPAREPRAERPAREPRGDSKQATVITMLQREGGATNPAIQAATGWQPHTVRGFFAGLKNKGYSIESTRQEGGTVYRIPATA